MVERISERTISRACERRRGADPGHNHPSGDPTPSKADIAVTKDIKKTAAPLGLALHEHLIIGRNSRTSLRDLKLI